MNPREAQATAAELLSREGLYLDRQEWDAWLELYAEDVVYWVPGWLSEDQLVHDVRRQISLIYHEDRIGLAERILRIRTRKSVTAMPLPRTVHMAGNVLAEANGDDVIEGTASWSVDEYDPRTNKAHRHFGLYEFQLRRYESGWKFQRKKSILFNDLIPTVVDFYNL